ncbi:MAG: hypothetical protein AAGE80_17435 [Pseudomonadota bacterium]
MELLFKREQTTGKLARVNFKLWSKLDLDSDEQAIVKRYRFDEAVLIEAFQPGLLRKTMLIGGVVFCAVFGFLAMHVNTGFDFLLGAGAGGGAAYWYFNEKRETIFVRDLLHGRHFTCNSVIELARKEAWLTTITEFLRQVMESAKHWDGTEHHAIAPLPKEEARQVILEGI